MLPAVGRPVSRDFTVFQFDVDEATVRRVLSALPGVTPVPPGDDASDGPESERTDADGDPTATGPGRPGGAPNRGHRSTPADRSTVSTPWPGAPGEREEEEPSGGLRGRLSSRRVLLAVGLVLSLGVVGVAVLWLTKGRGSRDGLAGLEEDGDERAPAAGSREGTASEDRDSSDGDRQSADDGDEGAERSYPIDRKAVGGIAFLVTGTVLLRYLRSSDDGE